MTKENVFPSCPRCESKKVTTRSKAFYIFLFLVASSCLTFIGLFLWIFLPFGVIGFLLAVPMGLMIPNNNQCIECKHVWKVAKK
jgi:hypothetical protein